jgi:hypothetical protein
LALSASMAVFSTDSWTQNQGMEQRSDRRED